MYHHAAFCHDRKPMQENPPWVASVSRSVYAVHAHAEPVGFVGIRIMHTCNEHMGSILFTLQPHA